jgi:predicted O-methyltransferase YrrM
MAQVIKLNKSIIDNIDLSEYVKYVDWNDQNLQYFELEAGKEHYKLLSFFAKELKTTKPLFDIGTYFGFSATALGVDASKKVISYDIYDWIPDDKFTVKKLKNVELRCMDCLDDLESLLDTDFICLDISPHDGLQEQVILDALKKYKYKGLLFLDDIHLCKDMDDFWNNIDLPKYDISKYGHFSGTGIVVFDNTKFSIILE